MPEKDGYMLGIANVDAKVSSMNGVPDTVRGQLASPRCLTKRLNSAIEPLKLRTTGFF